MQSERARRIVPAPINLDVADMAVHETDRVLCAVEHRRFARRGSFRFMPRPRSEGRGFRDENVLLGSLIELKVRPAIPGALAFVRAFPPLNA